MVSQLDLDQGGTNRQLQRTWMGPTIGWVMAPASVILPIAAAGTTTVLIGNTLVTVNVNGAVTIQLYSTKPSAAGAAVVSGPSIQTPLTIVDIGGFAQAHPITILPAAGELIDGQASIQITAAFGAFVLTPNIAAAGGWSLTQ